MRNRASVVLFANGDRGWAYDLIDTSTQSMSSNYVDEENGFRSIPFRYVWPAELDLMAREHVTLYPGAGRRGRVRA